MRTRRPCLAPRPLPVRARPLCAMGTPLPPRSAGAASSEGGAGRGDAAAQAGQWPMVLLCAGCGRAAGDTLDWAANDERRRGLLLRHISPTVSVDKEQKVSTWPEERGCMLETLSCSGCKMILGSFYRCTPRHLDYKRNLYCLNIDCLESYTLGAAEQKADVDKEPLTLGSQAILEKSLERAETTLKALEHRLSLVESSFASLPKDN